MFVMNEEQKQRLKDIGEICQICRINSKTTREQVAKELNITIHDVCNFENGRVNNAIIYDYYLSKFIY